MKKKKQDCKNKKMNYRKYKMTFTKNRSLLSIFGASASAKELFAAFGFTTERVVALVEDVL
jgi:transketolase